MEYINTIVPMLQILLLINLRNYLHVGGLGLVDKEILDNTPWEELVRRNQEELAKQFAK